MSKKVASRRVIGELQAVNIPAGLQRAVLIMLAVAWFGAAVDTGVSALTIRGSSYSWEYIVLLTALPFLFLVTALWYSWGRYHQLLQKLFVAGILATSGYAAAQVLISVLFTINNRFGWIVPNDVTSNATLHTFEWFVMLLGYALFVVVIGLLPHQKKERS